MKIRTILMGLFAAAFVLGTGGTSAQAATRAGDAEISAAGSIQNTDAEGFKITTVSLFGSMGYFTDKQLQVGGSLLQMSSDIEGQTSLGRFIDAYVKYHLNPDEVAVPYVGAQGGMINFEAGGDSSSGISYGFMAGVKYFATEDVSVNGEYNYRSYKISVGGTDISVNTTTFLVGLSLYFSAK